jgi:hypothetical protein
MSKKWLKTSKNVLTTSTKPLKMSKNHQNNVKKMAVCVLKNV